MKSITLSVDEEELAAVRRHAVARASSVNGLVREFLVQGQQVEPVRLCNPSRNH